jgi:hypothetical protein
VVVEVGMVVVVAAVVVHHRALVLTVAWVTLRVDRMVVPTTV